MSWMNRIVVCLLLAAGCGEPPASPNPVSPELPLAADIAGGGDYACAILEDGRVRCVGDIPGQPPATDIVSLAGGGLEHACGLRADGGAFCWGVNTYDKLGSFAGPFTELAAGTHHSCGLHVDGSIQCWGLDDAGQSAAPEGTGYRGLSASRGGHHSCAIGADSAIVCWGGDPAAHVPELPADAYVAMALTRNGGCALTRGTGLVHCWGEPFFDGPTDGGFTQISAGRDFVCGLRALAIECWSAASSSFSLIPPSGEFRRIGAGYTHVCALRTNGGIACRGTIEGFPGVAR